MNLWRGANRASDATGLDGGGGHGAGVARRLKSNRMGSLPRR